MTTKYDPQECSVVLGADAELEHRERLAIYRAQLEAKRQLLAELEAQPVIERPGRRLLEWSIPVAAVALVAVVGFLAVGEERSLARAADHLDAQQQLLDEQAPAEARAERGPESETVTDTAPESEPRAEPESQPEPRESEAIESSKTESSKSGKTKSSKPKSSEPKSKPLVKKNSKPLELDDFGGDPLG